MSSKEYYCSGVVKNQRQEQYVKAVSEKQALFFFKSKYGYAMRDVQVVEVMDTQQIQFNL